MDIIRMQHCNIKTIIALFVFCNLVSCNDINVLTIKDAELKTFVETYLNPGDSQSKIEKFLKDNAWHYTFNTAELSYEIHYTQGNINTLLESSKVDIIIFLNHEKEFKDVTINRLYTCAVQLKK